jgi:hypothetical protein
VPRDSSSMAALESLAESSAIARCSQGLVVIRVAVIDERVLRSVADCSRDL